MTITSNIVLGVAAWQSSHAYTAGAGTLVANSGNAYVCITSGTSASSGGPTTTASDISDGTAHWQYLCAITYTSLATWASGIPGTPSQPIIGLVLAGAAIAIPAAGSPYLSLSGHSTTPTNTITLSPFPGYGIGADIFTGLQAAALSTTTAVCFVAPGSTTFAVNYFDITDANVVIDGLQFQDPNSASGCTLLKNEAGSSNFVLRNCIFDGYGQASGASIIEHTDQCDVYNNIIVDRQPAGSTNPTVAISSGNGDRFVNNTIRKINGESGGTTTAVNWATSTGAIFRNNAIYGYANPFGSGIGGSASADHNVTDASTFVSAGLTVGTGNVVSTTAVNQFVNATTDFRLKAGAACINAGISDITDIPSGTDLTGRTRTQWDAGAVSFFTASVNSATAVIPALSLVPIAAASLLQNTAHTNNLTGFSPGFSSGFGPAPANLRIINLVSVGALGKSLNARASFNIAATAVILTNQSDLAFTSVSGWSTAFSPSFGPFYNLIMLMIATASANNSLVIAGIGNLPPLAAVAYSITPATASVVIPPLVCIATAGQFQSTISLPSIGAVGSMTSLTTAVGSAAIIIQPIMSVGQSDGMSAKVSIPAQRVIGQLSGFDLASATVAVSTIVASGVIGFSGSATVSLPPLVLISAATLAGQASGVATLPPIRTPDAVRPELQADPSAGIFLLADATGMILRADVPRARMLTESTNTSSTTAIPPLVCLGIAFESDVATLTRNIANMASVVALGQADLAVGSASTVLAVSSQAVQQRGMTALAALESLQAVVVTGQSDIATSTVTLALAASGAAGQVNQAHATLSINVALVANGGPTLTGSGLATVLPLAAVATMANVNGATGSARISLAVSAALGQQANASAADAVATLAVVASSRLQTTTSATVAIPALTSVAALGQSEGSTGSGTIVLGAAGNVQNLLISASATVTVPPLAVVATASISGAKVSGISTIVISAASASGQANFAATIASLAVLAETNATLYVSPIGYETGADVVYWPA